jgi:hypothetical protein
MMIDVTRFAHAFTKVRAETCAKRNDRQKIELNVEILEGHLGCMKSTHSMNAATWGR